MTIAGHHHFRYAIDYRWGISAAGKLKVKDCHEMVMDSNGLLYLLTNEIRNNILVYDKSGVLKNSWTLNLPGAHGLTLAKEGNYEYLFITDTDLNKVYKTTLDGSLVQTITYPKEPGIYENEILFKPTETAVAANGDVYVTDGYGLQYIIQYNQQGKYIRHWGGRGKGNSCFDCAHGIAIDNRNEKPTLLITSRNENCFKRFSMEGVYMETIYLPGSFVCRPVIHGDNLYAAVFRSGKNQLPASGYITILDKNNKVVSTPGGTEPVYSDEGVLQAQQQQQPPLFVHPHDVCVDEEGNIYVAQWNAGNSFPVKLTLLDN